MHVAAIWRESIIAFFRTPLAVVALAINLALAVLNNIYFDEDIALGIIQVQNLINLLFQFLITRQILQEMDIIQPLDAHDQRGFGSAFLVSLLSGLGIFIGFLLLVVPGIFLALRWTIALPVMVSTHANPTDSLRQSWDMTEPYSAKLLMVYLPLFAAFTGYFGAILWFENTQMVMIADIAIEPFIAIAWILPCIIFNKLRKDDREIFA